MEQAQSSSSNEEDQAIIRTTNELLTSLSVNHRVVGATWMGNIGHLLSLSSDQCVFIVKGSRRGFVVLPVELKGKLSMDDWKPIIASCILHSFAPQFKRLWGRMMLLWKIATVCGFAFLFIFLVLHQPVVDMIALVFVFAMLFIMPKFLNYHVFRESRLRADRKTAEIMGRDQLVRTLVKIDNMHILDLEELKRSKRTMWQRRVFPWPTLIERLDNLRQP